MSADFHAPKPPRSPSSRGVAAAGPPPAADGEFPPIMPEVEADGEPLDEDGAQETSPEPQRLRRRRRGKRLVRGAEAEGSPLTGQQRLLLLDTWRRSGLPAGDFAALVGMSKHTLYSWKKKFETEGPAGLEDKPRGGPTGSRLPEVTKRTILMLKQDNPD